METYFGHPHTCNLSDRINEAVQRSVINNLKALIANPDDDFARSELMWASAMGENGILKLGKDTDFQCHMIEHQLGPIPTAIMARDWLYCILSSIDISTRTQKKSSVVGRRKFGWYRMPTRVLTSLPTSSVR